MTITKDALVGFAVGTLDVAFLWPFVVVACRREAGSPSILHAVRQGNLWAGGFGALTMLVPYCVMVEALSNLTHNNNNNNHDDNVSWFDKALKTPLTSFVIAVGLQPIEKKIVMDSLSQTVRSGKGPFMDVLFYAKTKGVSRLMFSGLLPLWARETIYVSAVTILNPMMTTTENSSSSSSLLTKCFSAFSIGFCAGMITAPIQTLNVMQKDERNVGQSIRRLVFPPPEQGGFSIQRLFFGAGSRSFRTGAAGVLWFLSRSNIGKLSFDDNNRLI